MRFQCLGKEEKSMNAIENLFDTITNLSIYEVVDYYMYVVIIYFILGMLNMQNNAVGSICGKLVEPALGSIRRSLGGNAQFAPLVLVFVLVMIKRYVL